MDLNKSIFLIPHEEDRLTADHYGQFCRKIYRLVKFEQTDLFSWMNARQKIQLAEMIKDSGIEDEQVYEKLYEIFNQTKGEAREEADEIITLGCRQFIGNILGDEIAEEIEDMRWSRNVSSQYIAAVLMMKNQELENSADEQRKEKQEEEEDHTTRVRESLSICKRIYLDYNGSCSCNGFSDTCDSTTHTCQMCSENRAGHQCESCAKDFEMINSTCVRRSCQCNNHSEKCSGLICQECQHNTVGEQCELCADGFYGDATQGECKQCPCPKSGECSINSENILECSDCPVGFVGISCDIDSKTYSLNLSTTTIFQQTTTPMNNINNSIEDNDV
ncbi:unnamed protein product [Caenorhabditis angaria]|uniref:Laminin EGF-like domain-containing protein n=1 Tax=Caenorhabditis angaria TaxID=860376 RepID=A0A9P1N655_9PELO|nr:unnamed protein product [Caenorhabditis angaria]